MGCIRLSILENQYKSCELLEYTVKKELTYKNSIKKGYSGYFYGYNTQERVDEISGKGNHYTAPYWEYSPRIVRRWNRDPMALKYPWQSPYVINNNNPLSYYDPMGLEGEDPETIGSKSEKTAQNIIKRNGGAKNLSLSNAKLTTEEKSELFSKGNSNEDYSIIGEQVESILRAQSYLERRNKEVADVFSGLSNSGNLTNAELTELQDARLRAVEETQGLYMMGIGDNIGTVLFMSLGNSSASLQGKAASFSPKFAQSSAKVWSSISGQAPNIAGTQIPKYFTLNNQYFVNPNATKHMAEYVGRFGPSHSMPLRSQLTLSSFKSAVDQVSKQGNIVMGKMYKAGNWEIMFSKARVEGGLPVIKHARMLK